MESDQTRDNILKYSNKNNWTNHYIHCLAWKVISGFLLKYLFYQEYKYLEMKWITCKVEQVFISLIVLSVEISWLQCVRRVW